MNLRSRRRISLPTYAAPALVAAACLFIANAAVQHEFLAQSNWAPTMAGATVVIILAMAQAAPVISGQAGVDLSVGPLAGLVNAVIVAKLTGNGITTPLVVIPCALAMGMTAGLLNGILVAWVRVPAIVVTLGTYLVFAGLTLQILPQAGGTAPGWLSSLTGDAGPIPGLLLVIVALGVVWSVLMRTAFGRNLLATGSDERAAYTAGVDTAATRVLAYIVSGTFAAVGGLVLTAVLGSGDPTVAPNYTLESIAAVALGGIALSGGRGGVLGAGLGGAVLFLIQNLLALVHVDIYRLQIVYGLLVLLAIAANTIVMRRGNRGWPSAGKPARWARVRAKTTNAGG